MSDKEKIKAAVSKLRRKDPRVIAIRNMIALAKVTRIPENGKDGMRGADGINGINGIDGMRGADGMHGAKGLDGSKGEIGAVGPQGDKGEAGMIWRGTYRNDIEYDIGDVVGVSGSAYVCVAATNQAPPVGFGWELLVSRGAQGIRGIKGEDGGGGAAAAGTLTGTTLAANVLASSLESVGLLESLSVTNPIVGNITGNAATATSASNALSANSALTATTATTAGTVTTAAQPSITSVGTLTSLTVSAGTTAIAPIRLQSGTNLTTPTSGAVEFDGKVFYSTVATGRGFVPSVQIIIPSADFTLVNDISVQDIFASSQNLVTLQANTTYMFESMIIEQNSAATATSHYTTLALSLDGGATASSFIVSSMGFNTTLFGAAVTAQNTVCTDEPSTGGWVATTTTNAAFRCIKFEGTIRVTDGGTMIPQLVFSTAPGNTTKIKVGSYFKIYAIGSDTIQTIGAIS